MDDHEIEKRLRRYHLAGPTAELRERAVRGAGLPLADTRSGPFVDARGRLFADARGRQAERSLWWQLAATAALIVAATWLHSATARIDRGIAVATAPARDAEQRALDELTRELGDDPSARLIAEVILMRERRAVGPLPDAEVPQ